MFKHLLAGLIVLVLFAANSFGQEDGKQRLAAILLQQGKCLSSLTSVEFTVQTGTEGGLYFSKAHWKEMGERYWLDYYSANKKTNKEYRLLISYDGDHGYEFSEENGRTMYIQKGPFTKYDDELSDFTFLGPFRPFQFLRLPSVRVGVDGLQSATTLQSAIRRATLQPDKNRSWNGHPCIAVKISDGYDPRDHKTVDYMVYFGTDCDFFPIAWEMLAKNGHFIEGFSIKALKTVHTDKGLLRYPEAGCEQAGWAIDYMKQLGRPAPEGNVISFPEIKVNCVDKADFSLDPGMASTIMDIDSNIHITVPK